MNKADDRLANHSEVLMAIAITMRVAAAAYPKERTEVAIRVAERIETAARTMDQVVEALDGLAGVLENDCGVEPCAPSMNPSEHYLGLARAALSAYEGKDNG